MRSLKVIMLLQFVGVTALSLASTPATAQFSVVLPQPVKAEEVAREDLQMLFMRWHMKGFEYKERTDSLRKLLNVAKADPGNPAPLADLAKAFCEGRPVSERANCAAALTVEALYNRFASGTNGRGRPLGTTLINSKIPFWYTSRSEIGEYLRLSGGQDAFSIAPQFSANVGENEAYVVTSIVRGVIGRGIFAADQAVVVTRSSEADTIKRAIVEDDRANALRAINNGGTLVGRYTVPLFARAGATLTSAVGLTASAGVLGPISGGSDQRTGVASGAFEAIGGFPVRDPNGGSSVLADLIIGARVGHTYAGRPIISSDSSRHVTFGQLMVGLRQNGNLSVSVLATFANNGFNKQVPRLAVNFAAHK